LGVPIDNRGKMTSGIARGTQTKGGEENSDEIKATTQQQQRRQKKKVP